MLDYPLYFPINSVFANASGNTQQIENRYDAIAANYDPASQMQLVTFLDNHDQPRFLSTSGANTRPSKRRPHFSLHRAGYSLFVLRHGAGLRRRRRSE